MADSETRDQHLDTDKTGSDITRAARDKLEVNVEGSLLVSCLDGGHNLHETLYGLSINGSTVEVVKQQVDAALCVVDHSLLRGWSG